MGSGPGAVGHNDIDGSADAAVKASKKMPVFFLQEAAEAHARASVETFSESRGDVKGAEHVGRYGRIVDIGAGGDGGKEEPGKGKGKGVSHGVDEDVGNEKREGIIGEKDGA